MSEEKVPVEIFKALGDETRLKIFLTLSRSPDRLCVSDVVKQLGISQPAVSQHLKILKAAGLADSARKGHKIHYGVNREFFRDAIEKLVGLVMNVDAVLPELLVDSTA